MDDPHCLSNVSMCVVKTVIATVLTLVFILYYYIIHGIRAKIKCYLQIPVMR